RRGAAGVARPASRRPAAPLPVRGTDPRRGRRQPQRRPGGTAVTRCLLVAGGGGVGKTTVAAALGVTAARSGLRTLVLTVDPAQRLASALGLAGLGHEPEPHADLPDLWVAML